MLGKKLARAPAAGLFMEGGQSGAFSLSVEPSDFMEIGGCRHFSALALRGGAV